ncbi:hypothetical protein ACIRBX_16435 [Kitasatospora sp. NPDC096147]|uniref:hypothetical protein n=1 Tax=Kitasatospora sp. NPDC096147 TaxID=3364093 RepID=UPI00381BBD34
MTGRRRWPALFVLVGLLALAAYAWGVYEDRSGGRTLVAVALFRPLIVGGAGLVLLAVAVAARTRTGRVAAGLLTACTLLYATGALVLQDGFQRQVTSRQPRPGAPGDVLTVTYVGNAGTESELRSHELTLRTGSGWGERHWSVATLPEIAPDGGTFKSAVWADRGHVLVTTTKGTRTIAVPAP